MTTPRTSKAGLRLGPTLSCRLSHSLRHVAFAIPKEITISQRCGAATTSSTIVEAILSEVDAKMNLSYIIQFMMRL